MIESIDHRRLFSQFRLSPSDERHYRMITRFLMEMEMESHPEYAQYLQEYNKKAVNEGAKPFKEQLVQASKIAAEVSENAVQAKEAVAEEKINVAEVPPAEEKQIEVKPIKKKSFPKKK